MQGFDKGREKAFSQNTKRKPVNSKSRREFYRLYGSKISFSVCFCLPGGEPVGFCPPKKGLRCCFAATD